MSKLDSYNNIPSEIWYKIIQHLSQRDIRECQKVCKSWYLSTRHYFWENLELKTVDHVELFLKSSSKDINKFIKSVVIGNKYYEDYSVQYTLSKEQVKGLLFNLPNLEELHIAIQFSNKLIAELNNKEFLIEFRKNCPNIRSFRVYGAPIHQHEVDYFNIMYSLRDTATSIIIKDINYNTYRHIPSFTRMEHITIIKPEWSLKKFLGFLNKIKTLKRLKYLCFNMNFTFQRNNGHDFPATNINIIQRVIEADHAIKERLASLEKLHLFFDSPYDSLNCNTNFIKQYFTGLKEIHVIYCSKSFQDNLSDDFLNEWINFIFSHDKYKLEIEDLDSFFMGVVVMLLKNNFKQNSTSSKNVTKHLWLVLDCSAYDKLSLDKYYYWFEFATLNSLRFESKEIDNNQYLNVAKIYSMDSEYSLSDIYNYVLNSTKCIMQDINTLTFEFVDVLGYVKYPFPYNTFQITDQILSLATDALKKVIIIIDSDYKWSKYFVKYEKVKTYRQVTHLEINAVHGKLLDELSLSQCIAVFPCIKYLTLEHSIYINPAFTDKNNQLFINLPQINLKRLSLDATIFKLMAQEAMKTEKDFLDTYFMLKVETDKKSYYYQISMGFLNVSELIKGNEEFDIKNSLKVHIRFKDIECLELYLISYINTEKNDIRVDSDILFFDCNFLKEKICERRIYFE